MNLQTPTLDEISAARERLASTALRTPLVRLPFGVSEREIHLKLENLQPIGSFKIRGAANAMALHRDRVTSEGVYTASAGNMAQGVAWCARELGVPCTVIVPDQAPQTKLDAIERLGGSIIKRPFDEWWNVIVNHGDPEMNGLFIHPFADSAVMAGNGTIGLEILEDLDDVDAILVPYGGGGLSCGIGSAVRALSPNTRVYAVEVETAAPLSASLRARTPTAVSYMRTFIDGMGSAAVSDEMWPLAQSLLAGSLVVTVAQIASAIKLVAERCRVVAEGAGAASLAAALHSNIDAKRIVCVISGGNIDSTKLATILAGDIP
ncbi:MAG TPA: pyridoxal-phosphate dependent enzyme [Gemmatimonadaceae bacterium]|nr:pyridoxal-phosphate dependent enzyme [Gemmatimonadaceae bacterium]